MPVVHNCTGYRGIAAADILARMPVAKISAVPRKLERRLAAALTSLCPVLFSFKNFVPVTVKNRVRVRVSSRVRVRA